ncbi:Phenylpropionate dioxygenase, large terminal subunit [Alteribacillus persepolensis]|uniref:Phenylpropionate dioxygenase, large terminal subunit n=1 Tax=Alteribacillus persepolensis TaxID=568899 RepID=A0A1G8AWM8_9BACI|nr:Rieske 2Fe-2S domain-containing protein [Alteribacillus persepolensis]SDH25307.1 Phenylpropionate dioxygenase, large terminal subunit [Alteribacillus persepolensis]
MLSKENNELLTRVTGDAPMAMFMKQFWVPAVRAGRLESGGEPVRVTLFGESYVAFRADNGQVGFFDEACPHRGTSLALGRNEDNALTCLFHGWKFDVSGQCVEAPTEPAERMESFCKKVPLKHYKVREAGGIVWVWLGEGEPTQFPDFEFNNLPESNLLIRIAEVDCNWLQILEGTLDSAHVSVLHKSWTEKVGATVSKTKYDLSPRYEIDPQPYGYRAGALRNMPNGDKYVRISEYVQPWYSFIPKSPEENHVGSMVIPIDDYRSVQWFVFYNYNRELTFEDAAIIERQFGIDPNNPVDNFYEGSYEERWKQDRSKMKDHFTGLYGVLVEDYVINEGMGKIVDRSKEYLGSSDMLITRIRRHLLKGLKDMQEDKVPKGLDEEVDYFNIRSTNGVLPQEEDWRNTPK